MGQYRTLSGIVITSIRQQDMESIRRWRNSQLSILRQQVAISENEQQRYFQERVVKAFDSTTPSEILLSIIENDVCIGYGGFVHIDWIYKRAEISFILATDIIETSERFEQLFIEFVTLLKQIAFTELGFHRLTAECYATRPKMPFLLQKGGFREEGIFQEHVFKDGKWVDALRFGLIHVECAAPMQQAVLISCCSKKVPLVEAVRKAAIKAQRFACIHGADSDPNVICRYFVEYFWNIPSINDLSIETVIDYCKQHGIGAIIPTSDLELDFWASHKQRLATDDIFVMVSSSETIAICRNKMRFMEKTEELEICAIPTATAIEGIHATWFVVKEQMGAGSRKIGLRLNRQQALDFAQDMKAPVFQPYIEGIEFSIDVYVHNTVRGIVVRRRDRIVDGESQITTTVRDSLIESKVERLALGLGIEGHAVFQVIKTAEGTPYFLECNPRFGGASTASLFVGLDSFFWFFSECAQVDNSSFTRNEQEFSQIRYPKDTYRWS